MNAWDRKQAQMRLAQIGAKRADRKRSVKPPAPAPKAPPPPVFARPRMPSWAGIPIITSSHVPRGSLYIVATAVGPTKQLAIHPDDLPTYFPRLWEDTVKHVTDLILHPDFLHYIKGDWLPWIP